MFFASLAAAPRNLLALTTEFSFDLFVRAISRHQQRGSRKANLLDTAVRYVKKVFPPLESIVQLPMSTNAPRRRFAMMLAALSFAGSAFAQEPTALGQGQSELGQAPMTLEPVPTTRMILKPISPPEAAAAQPAPPLRNDVIATGGSEPVKSTMRIRIARRPWLLEKLTKPKTEPSVKMNPPRPPADLPQKPATRQAQEEGWVSRGDETQPLYSDLRSRSQKAQSTQQQPPQSDQKAAAKSEQASRKAQPNGKAQPSGQTQPSNVATETPQLREAPKAGSTDAQAKGEPEAASNVEVIEASPLAIEGNAKSTQQSNKTKPRDATTQVKTPAKSNTKAAEPKLRAPAEPKLDSPAEAGASARVESDNEPVVIAEPAPPRLDYTGYPLQPLRMTRSVAGMKRSIRSCLQYYYSRPEIANERSNWGMLHSIMVFGVDTKVVVGRKRYSAIAWIAGNNACRGQKLLRHTPEGIQANSGVGLQGHQAQMLAVFALCDVPIDYPLYADDEKYTVRDLVDAEMAACKRGAELTFTLIGLSHYLDTDARWVASDGQRWDFEKLIREELSQPIVGAACGGTHRLMGFAHALRKRRAEDKPIDGQWRRADMFTQDFHSYCYRLQNRDGSMSTDWFEGREDNGNLDRKIQTTGHMVEWLLSITPDSQLQNPRLVSAVRFLLSSMYNERDHEWKIGPKGHALRSLAMFYERAYRSGPAWRPPKVMAQSSDSTRR